MSEIPRGEQPEEGAKPEYNFELMKEMEPVMSSLVMKLKTEIETGEYGALLSDEVGGRIPTLILRKIMKEKGPNVDIKTFFLAAGTGLEGKATSYIPTPFVKTRRQDYEKLKSYLKKAKTDKKLLIITEFIQTGHSIHSIVEALQNLGIQNFDIATLYLAATDYPDNIAQRHRNISGKKIIYGSDEEFDPGFGTMHHQLSGLTKSYYYQPYPTTAAKYKREGKPLARTDKESQIQEKINKAREDVDLMAERVIEKVWEK
jgi:hypoxanthine phosphoribosyltransferase